MIQTDENVILHVNAEKYSNNYYRHIFLAVKYNLNLFAQIQIPVGRKYLKPQHNFVTKMVLFNIITCI